MNTALYYPFTGPERSEFVKIALFLWDSVDFIVPFRDFRPHGNTKEEQEGLDLIARTYVPTKKDQRAVHEEFERICREENPNRLIFELSDPESGYNFYPRKLLPETWELLADSNLAQIVRGEGDIRSARTNRLFGYYMMSVLAACCAGDRKRLVTDNHDPYRALANLMVDEPNRGVEPIDWHGRLISVSLSGPDFSKVPLAKMIELRNREDQLMQSLRRKFLAEVEIAASEIAKHSENGNVVRDVMEDYMTRMELDFKELKLALRRSAKSLFFSKETLVAVSAFVAGPVTGGISSLVGAAVTVGGLKKGLMDYQDRRRKILSEHPSSWLLSAYGPKIPYC